MNISISEVLPVMTLMENLQTGMSPREAAAKYQQQIFEHGNAWSADSIQYFYPRVSHAKTERMVKAVVQAITQWRREGGATPLDDCKRSSRRRTSPARRSGSRSPRRKGALRGPALIHWFGHTGLRVTLNFSSLHRSP